MKLSDIKNQIDTYFEQLTPEEFVRSFKAYGYNFKKLEVNEEQINYEKFTQSDYKINVNYQNATDVLIRDGSVNCFEPNDNNNYFSIQPVFFEPNTSKTYNSYQTNKFIKAA